MLCEFCDLKFPSNFGLQRHVNGVHLGKKSIGCRLCDNFSTAYKASLAKHVRRRHLCPTCGQLFRKTSDLQEHQGTRHPLFRCRKCPLECVEKRDMDRHETECNGEEAEGCVCPICRKTFSREDSLLEHRQLVHSESEPLKCPECDFETRHRKSMYRHERANHPNRAKPEEKPRPIHSCDNCPYSTPMAGNLRAHVRAVHARLKEHACPNCAFTTAYAQTLDSHLANSHPGVPNPALECAHCEVVALSRSQLRRHESDAHRKAIRTKVSHDSHLQEDSRRPEDAVPASGGLTLNLTS